MFRAKYEAPFFLSHGIQMKAHVEHLLGHSQVEEIPEPIGVPAQALVDASFLVEVAVHDYSVFLRLADASIGADQRKECPKPRILHDLREPLGEERGKGKALDKASARGSSAVEDGNAVDGLTALLQPLGFHLREPRLMSDTSCSLRTPSK